jgi:hypothetical protein
VTVSILPLSLLRGMLNLITVLQAFITSKYSEGISVVAAALSKKSLTCSKKRGSLNSSSFGPKFLGSTSKALEENNLMAKNVKR